MAVHCHDSGFIGKYIPRGPRDFPSAGILHPSGNLSVLGGVFPNASFLSAVYAEHPKQTHCLVHQPSGNQHCTTLSKLCVYLRNNCTTRFVYHFNKLGRVKTSLQALKLRKFETLLTEWSINLLTNVDTSTFFNMGLRDASTSKNTEILC